MAKSESDIHEALTDIIQKYLFFCSIYRANSFPFIFSVGPAISQTGVSAILFSIQIYPIFVIIFAHND